MSATIAPSVISCHADHYGLQKTQLGWNVACFPPLAACLPTFGTMIANPQGEGFHVRSSSNPPNPVSTKPSVFSQRELPQPLGSQAGE